VSFDIGTAAGAGQVSFSAKGGSTGGNGGSIVMSSAPVNIKTANAINASALSGNGNGGEIVMYSYLQSFDPAATITAIGKGTGKGGRFSAFHSIMDIDILKFVKVDGGATVPTTELNGSIRLNDVWCRQWRLTGTQVWPKTHWVCTDQSDNPSVPVAATVNTAAADVAKSAAFNNLRTRLGNAANKATIFVFSGSANFNSFWAEILPAKAGGLTFKSALNSPFIYVNPWLSGSVGNPNNVVTYTYNSAREVAAHELGHAVDRSFAGIGTLPSRDALYNTYVQRDVSRLDYADPAANTNKRLPCDLTPNPAKGFFPGNIPFAGAIDVPTGLPVCSGGQLNNNIASWPVGVFNSQVVTTLDGALWVPTLSSPQWVEPHAQVFSHGAVGSQGARGFFDKVLDNGYFLCLKSWATSERANALPVAACAL